MKEEEKKTAPATGETGKAEPTFKQELFSLIRYAAVVIILTWLIIHFVGVRTVVIGDSMWPMLEDGNNLIVEKLTYYVSDPQRFDIVVFPYPQNTKKHYIKRVVGLPGETIQIIDGQIYINGSLLEEDYGNEPMRYAGIASEPLLLGENEYFVLGDNRNNSEDSRYEAVGVLTKKQLFGKAWVRIWPLNAICVLKHQ